MFNFNETENKGAIGFSDTFKEVKPLTPIKEYPSPDKDLSNY